MNKKIKTILKPLILIYSFFMNINSFIFRKWLLYTKDVYSIPIFVISYNRLDYLKKFLTSFGAVIKNPIIIIDNCSTYQPLLNYYKTITNRVIYMKKNYGYKVFFKHPKFFFIRNFRPFFISDPDLILGQNCPKDIVEKCYQIMKSSKTISRVGLSLRINDIPDSYYLKDEVQAWESRYWAKKVQINGVDCFKGQIDTTFALNCPRFVIKIYELYSAFRLAPPYEALHLPWYVDSSNISKEEENYKQTLDTKMTTWNGNFSKEEIKNRYNL